MFELITIEVENFRSFSQASFSPLGIGQGMTAINGSNGMGKSTLVHALLWAVYGITPDGVPVKALRRQGSDGDVIAKVTFRHEGQTIEVTRSLRGRNDTTMATIALDGVEQTNISSKTATTWMEKRLNLDSEAFLTAFVVRQKELDSLVKARPAERRKTIERLAGIERMSAALTLARQEARDAQKMLEALPVTETPENAEKEMLEASAAYEAASSARENAKNDLDEKKNKAEDAVAAQTALEEQYESLKTLENKLTLLSQKLESAENNHARLANLVEGAEDLPFAESSAEEAKNNLQDAEQVLSSVESAVVKAENAANRLEEAEKELERIENKYSHELSIKEGLTNSLNTTTDFEIEITNAEKEVETLGIDRGAARGEWERLKKAIETLKNSIASHDAACPTCMQGLEDPEGLMKVQEDLLSSVYSRGVELSSKYDAAVEKVSQLQKKKSEQSSIMIKIENSSEALKTIEEEKTLLKKNVSKLADEAESAAEAADQVQKQASLVNGKIEELREQAVKAQKTLIKAQQASEALEEFESYKQEIENLQASIDDVSANVAILKKETKNVDFIVFKNEVQTLVKENNEAAEKYAAVKTAYALAEKDLESSKEAYERAVKSAETRKLALAKVEITSAAANTLDEFRRDRLARLAPELSEVASDFVSRMTDGRYTSVELDEDFTPILTDSNGAQRPAAWLSGGEESAVALALRVAIGEVLAGQRGGLLILDEVLTAQDQTRRSATMAAIRALPRQIITINHVSEATDMVDLVAEIIQDENVEGASTVSVYSPDNGVPSDISDYMVDA